MTTITLDQTLSPLRYASTPVGAANMSAAQCHWSLTNWCHAVLMTWAMVKRLPHSIPATPSRSMEQSAAEQFASTT